MPTQTFVNLPKEKKDKILAAARKEFSSTAFEEASINKIVKEAGIPRGSFYMYFADKNDLLGVLLEEFRNQYLTFLKKKAARSKGDLKEMVVGIHDFILFASRDQENCGLIRNFLLYSASSPEHIANQFFQNMVNNFINVVDRSPFKRMDDDYVMQVVESCFAILKETIHHTLVSDRSFKASHERLENLLEIVSYGYLKEGDTIA